MAQPRLVVIGSSNTDLVVKAPHLPAPGETVIGGDVLINSGGKGANQAAAAARLGAAVHFVGKLGVDAFGDHAAELLENFGIDLSLVTRDTLVPSGVALITVAPDGNNQIAVAPGANSHLSPGDVDRARPAIAAADLVILQLEIPLPAVGRAIEIAAEEGTPVLLNPAPMMDEPLPAELLRQVALLVPNEVEAGGLLGCSIATEADARSAASRLLELGVGTAIVTLGKRGCIAASASSCWLQPAFAVNGVDATAAGDCFIGAFAVRFAGGAPLPECLTFAAAAAGLSVTREGAQQSIPFVHEVDSLIAAQPSAVARPFGT